MLSSTEHLVDKQTRSMEKATGSGVVLFRNLYSLLGTQQNLVFPSASFGPLSVPMAIAANSIAIESDGFADTNRYQLVPRNIVNNNWYRQQMVSASNSTKSNYHP